MKKILISFIAICGLQSCATYHTSVVYKDNIASEVKEGGVNVFLIGDGGLPENGDSPASVKSIATQFSEADEDDVLLFLGDNVYQKGVPDEDSFGYDDAKRALEVQANPAKNFPGTVLFIPGNHDWYSGLDGLKRQEELITEMLGEDVFLPKNGCPLEVVEVSDELAIIIVDSEWYIANWDDYPEINLECEEIDSRDKFLNEFRDALGDYEDRTTIVAMHHPLFTNGPHDGQFRNPVNPINFLRRTTGLVWEDLQHPLYRQMANRFITILQDYEDNVIVVSGHEHNLQYIERDEVKQIISGAASKSSPLRKRANEFGFPGKGYAILNIDQFRESVTFYDQRGKAIDEILVRKKFDRSSYEIDNNYSQTIKTSIYPKELFEKLPKENFLTGERYRKYYGTLFEAKVATLDTLYGGLSPVKLGGGFQSVNLRLVDKDGKEYAMRRMKKSAKQFIQREIFKETYVKDELKGTVPETFIFDFYTSSYPFATLTIGDMADAVDVYHTNPKMFYIPKHNNLGEFNEEIGDELFVIEERPSEEWKSLPSFGNSDDIESTDDVMQKVFEDEENTIDENQFIRTRLFDMWLGDWDRHSDQFRWAQFEGKDGKDVFQAIPRDRDWAMPKYDGLVLSFGTGSVPALRKMQTFEDDIKSIKYLNVGNYKFDLTLVQNSSLEQWLVQAEFLANNLSDETIEKAFLNIPVEFRDDVSESLKQKLKNRREKIKEWAEEYYKILVKHAVVTATHKDDFIDIHRLENGGIEVKVYRNKDGERGEIFLEKTYKPEETKEIWIYGLNDQDQFKLTGNHSPIRIHLIGGANKDVYDLEDHKKIRVYDWKSKENEFEGAIPIRDISDDYESNHFDVFKFQHNTSQNLPFAGYNPDSGVQAGLNTNFNIHKFSRHDYTTRHQLGANFHSATKGVDLKYKSHFRDIIKHVELELNARYTTPNYAENFFGYGNSTPFNDSINFEHYRVRQELMKFEPKIIRQGGRFFDQFHLSLPIQRIDIDNNEGRFVRNYFPQLSQQLDDNFYVGLNAGYHFKNYDIEIDPSLGLEFKVNAGYNKDISDVDFSFGYLKPSLIIVYPLALHDELKISTKIDSEFHFTEEILPFYFASTIGGNNGLRGFRNERFTGENSFFQSTDVRYKIATLSTFILPGNLGVYGGFDYGKVWMNNDDYELIMTGENNDRMNTSYGGGLYFNGSNLFTIKASYFTSDDGGRFVAGLGFDF